MSLIKIKTLIKSDLKICFDVARNVDIHQESLKCCEEIAISGKTYGTVKLGETVTWESKHFGLVQHLTSKITELEFPKHFVDEMVTGAFKSFRHEHRFKIASKKNHVLMTDILCFESPLGLLGKTVNALFLKRHMTKLLIIKNKYIKEKAESFMLEINLKAAS